MTDESKAAEPPAETGSAESDKISPDTLKQIEHLRTTIQQNFGKAVLAMSQLPRYRSQTLADLQHIVLDPLLHDRLIFAYSGKPDDADQPRDMAGFAIWANVSEEVDARIREQIKAGVFPIRLKREDWVSGEINWLLDVIAQDKKTTASVIANFGRVTNKDRDLRLHPMIARMVEPEVLEKMGARRGTPPTNAPKDDT